MVDPSQETEIALIKKRLEDAESDILALQEERKNIVRAIFTSVGAVVMLILPNLPSWVKGWLK